MTSALYGHTVSNVVSSTMEHKIIQDGSRFRFSHEFSSIPLKHLLQWTIDENYLEFCLRKTKKDDGEYGHIHDVFINNILYRPVELECLSLYELVERYEMKKKPRKIVMTTVMINITWKIAPHST